MDNNPTRYFDNILRLLSEEYNRWFTFKELLVYLYPKEMENAKTNVEYFFAEEQLKTKVINALMFLKSEGLLIYTEENVIISTKGFLKIKTGGFEYDMEQAKRTIRYQRFNWLASPIIAAIALGFSIYVLVTKEDNNNNQKINYYNCK